MKEAPTSSHTGSAGWQPWTSLITCWWSRDRLRWLASHG